MRSDAIRSSEATTGTEPPATSTKEKYRQGVSPTHSAKRFPPGVPALHRGDLHRDARELVVGQVLLAKGRRAPA